MLMGENGILKNVIKAKKTYQASSEKEAIYLIIASTQMDTSLGNNSNYVGKKLYTKNFVNSDKWDYIYTTTDNKSYGDGWYYITKNLNLDNYGKTQNGWLVNYNTNEIIELEDNEYVELAINDDILITNGLIFNIDSNDISISDKSTWGNGVNLYGFENNEFQDNDILYFDGIDDYISFKSDNTFNDGFTFSFYGYSSNSLIFSKQKAFDADYSCRFGWNNNFFSFNTSKKMANSTWSQAPYGGNNGNLITPCVSPHDTLTYLQTK